MSIDEQITEWVDENRTQLENRLPPDVDPDRVRKWWINEVHDCDSDNPVWRCKPSTVADSLIEAADLELRPGHDAWIVAFWNSDDEQYHAQLMVGYKGMLKLAYQHPDVTKVSARAVREHDEFEIEFVGDEERQTHRPALDGDRGDVVGAYCTISLRDAPPKLTYVDRESLKQIRATADTDYVWNDWPGQMAAKTAIRRALKQIPTTEQTERIVSVDDDRWTSFDDDRGTSGARRRGADAAAGDAVASRARSGDAGDDEDDEPAPARSRMQTAVSDVLESLGYERRVDKMARDFLDMVMASSDLNGDTWDDARYDHREAVLERYERMDDDERRDRTEQLLREHYESIIRSYTDDAMDGGVSAEYLQQRADVAKVDDWTNMTVDSLSVLAGLLDGVGRDPEMLEAHEASALDGGEGSGLDEFERYHA